MRNLLGIKTSRKLKRESKSFWANKYCAPTFYPWQFFYSSDFKDIYQLSTEVEVASGGKLSTSVNIHH